VDTTRIFALAEEDLEVELSGTIISGGKEYRELDIGNITILLTAEQASEIAAVITNALFEDEFTEEAAADVG